MAKCKLHKKRAAHYLALYHHNHNMAKKELALATGETNKEGKYHKSWAHYVKLYKQHLKAFQVAHKFALLNKKLFGINIGYCNKHKMSYEKEKKLAHKYHGLAQKYKGRAKTFKGLYIKHKGIADAAYKKMIAYKNSAGAEDHIVKKLTAEWKAAVKKANYFKKKWHHNRDLMHHYLALKKKYTRVEHDEEGKAKKEKT